MILEFVFQMLAKESTKYKIALAYLVFLVLLGLIGPWLIPFSIIPWEANFMDLSSVEQLLRESTIIFLVQIL